MHDHRARGRWEVHGEFAKGWYDHPRRVSSKRFIAAPPLSPFNITRLPFLTTAVDGKKEADHVAKKQTENMKVEWSLQRSLPSHRLSFNAMCCQNVA